MNNIIRNTISIEASHSIRWDKLRPEDIYNRYTAPVYNQLYDIFQRYKDLNPNEQLTDKLFDEIVGTLRQAEKRIPVSR